MIISLLLIRYLFFNHREAFQEMDRAAGTLLKRISFAKADARAKGRKEALEKVRVAGKKSEKGKGLKKGFLDRRN